MWKYIFLVALVVVAWSVVIWLEAPLWIAISVTSVVALIIATLLIIRFIKARRASREIERALKAQAEKQASAARPDLEADIRALQGEFNRAVTALKGSRLGNKGAASALYSLPWYVIVGPPGVGKSTALRNSGLKFPFLSSRGGVSVQGVGGTRNCEWWMTTEAIILDTAGRYTTESSDREEWFAFLDLLRKYRTRRPINGVLAAVNIADLSEAHPEEVASLAREVRARIDELQGRLGVVVPVYLVFTKCDLLPGFVEMFSDLSEEDRHQIWGFTLPATDQFDLTQQVTEHFDELTAVLEKRALRRLSEERSAMRRDRVYEFPQYVAGLRDHLSAFVHELMLSNIYNETPILRGVYLSSGTQEGRPVDRIMSSIAEAFGMRPTMGATAAPQVAAKSYFLGDIFRKVIFRDWKLTRHNKNRSRKLRLVGNLAGGLAVAAAIGTVWLPLMSFRNNRELLSDASTAIAYVEEHNEEKTSSAIVLDRIEPLRRTIELLAQYEDDGAPWSMRMGMYQGVRVYPRLRDVFADTVRRELLIPSVEEELKGLRKFMRTYAVNRKAPQTEEYQVNFDRLRMYLLLTAQQAGEPGLDEREREWLELYLGDVWERPLRVGGDEATRNRIEGVARTYLEVLLERPELAFERDDRLVERAREILRRADRTQAVANALIASVGGRSLDLETMVGAGSVLRNDDRFIRPAFTRGGYEETVKPRFEKGLDDLLDPQWVLARNGEGADKLAEQDIAAIKTEYYRQYISEWKNFVKAIYLDVPSRRTTMAALTLLEDLAPPREPYAELFTNIAWHTQIAEEDAPQTEEEKQGELEKQLRNAGHRVGNRAAMRAAGKLGLTQVGVSTGGFVTAAEKAMSERLIADPNAANVVTEWDVTFAFAPLAEFGAHQAPEVAADGGPATKGGPGDKIPLDEYHMELEFVRDALQARMDNPGEKEKLSERINKAQEKVRKLLAANESTTWAPTLDTLLWPPLKIASASIYGNIKEERQQAWCNEVVSDYERTIAANYPFNPRGHDVPLDDFAAFFQPEEGTLWSYYKTALSKEILQRGIDFKVADVRAGSPRYRGKVATFLEAAFEVSTAMYPPRSEDLKVEFFVMFEGTPGVSEVALTVDGEKLEYFNGPTEWHAMKWPGDPDKAGARLMAKGWGRHAELPFDGEWGLFRLLEQGKVKATPGGKVFEVQWNFEDEDIGHVRIKFKPKRTDTPFFGLGGKRRFMTIFRDKDLVVPRSVMKGAGGCGRGKSED